MALAIVMSDFITSVAFSGFDQTEPVVKEREWRTDVVGYDNWHEQRNQVASQPRRHWKINWAIMDKAARDKWIELFDAARGRFQTFKWKDSDEYLASAVQIVTDGSKEQYQLVSAHYDGEDYEWEEKRQLIVPGTSYPPVVTHSIDGAQTESAVNPPAAANQYYLDDSTGIMRWKPGSPPSVGVLTCTFEYYFRVRWMFDSLRDTLAQPGVYDGSATSILEVPFV